MLKGAQMRESWVRLLSFSCEICGSEGGDCEDYCAQGSVAVYIGR